MENESVISEQLILRSVMKRVYRLTKDCKLEANANVSRGALKEA